MGPTRDNKPKHKDKSFTMMIVPHSGHEIKKIKVPKLAIKVTSGALILIFAYTGYITYTYKNQQNDFLQKYSYLNNLYYSQIEKNTSLSMITENQQKEIEDLKNTTEMVRERLDVLAELEYQIREKYGMQAAQPIRTMEATKVNVTRGLVKSMSSDEVDIQEQYQDENDNKDDQDYDDILSILNTLSQEIDSKTSDLESLASQVDSKVLYLEHRPSRYPVSGKITSGYGRRLSPTGSGYEFHYGIDIGAPLNSPIYASASGKVIFAGFQGSYGRLIIIDHGYGIKTVYAHNSANLVKVGQKVEKGDLIARVGTSGRSTGPHVHFEVRQNNSPTDPVKFLNAK